MPRPSLKDPILELIRAKEHLDSLQAELRMFHTSMPTEVTVHEHADRKRKFIQVKIPVPPERLGLIAGDVTLALRAALDHLMWQTCLLKTETPNKRTHFPCAWSLDPRTGKKGTEARLIEATKEIPEAAAEKVKALQAYLRGDAYKDDPLWKIDELCNLAKHMVIPLQGASMRFEKHRQRAGHRFCH